MHKHACSTLYVMRAISNEIRLRQGNMKFNTQNEEWVGIRIIGCIIQSVYFSIHHVK
jgi:hypothetical protein